MQFNSYVRNALLAYLASDEKTPNGQACRFVPLEGFGAKVYGDNEDGARQAFENQRKGFEAGIAPAVGDFFMVRMRFGPKQEFLLYGYLTEMAERIGECNNRHGDPRYQALKSAMRQAGFGAGDLHPGNFGWIGERMVCIDFDLLSLACH